MPEAVPPAAARWLRPTNLSPTTFSAAAGKTSLAGIPGPSLPMYRMHCFGAAGLFSL